MTLESRWSLFNEVLKEEGLEHKLRVSQLAHGLGLVVKEHIEAGSEICRCASLLVYTPSPICKEVGDLRATLPHPALLPLPCYCAALACVPPAQMQSTVAVDISSTVSDLHERLFALSRPEAIAPGAPGMAEIVSSEGSHVVDATAVAIARAFGISELSLQNFGEFAKIWCCNAFEVGEDQLGIFLLPALCNHSCDPAAEYRIDSADGHTFRITLTACRVLDPGDDLTISYAATALQEAASRITRRKTLAAGWFFYCCCPACWPPADETTCRTPLCFWCGEELSVWISDIHGGPYEDTGEAPTCDSCGEVDLVVSGSYFFHCSTCEVDLCPDCGDKAET